MEDEAAQAKKALEDQAAKVKAVDQQP
jgi:hypothetical protein